MTDLKNILNVTFKAFLSHPRVHHTGWAGHPDGFLQVNNFILVGLATLTGSSRFILVGLATLTGSSRLILVGLGNLRFLQVNMNMFKKIRRCVQLGKYVVFYIQYLQRNTKAGIIFGNFSENG